jgi:alpha-L-fucosidase
VKAAGYNANFLLNVGPMPNGKIQPEFVKTLGEMGQWMNTYGETIYGTRKGPVEAREWGVTTAKGNKVYVHVLNWQDETLSLPLSKKVKAARLFGNKAKVSFMQNEYGLLLKIPANQRNDIDTVIELEL